MERSSSRSRGEGECSKGSGNFRAGDDLEADWNTDDSSSLSEFVQKRYMSQPKAAASNSCASSASDNQPKTAIKRASARMRRRREKQDMKKNGLNELLEMPKWEHPAPLNPSRGKRSIKGDASSKGSTLRQLLDGGDDESESEVEEGDYLQGGIVTSKSSARSGASRNSRISTKKGSEGSTTSSSSKHNIPLHLESEIETDDESTGVELFRSGKGGRSILDDDDGSISSCSVECFKPKPSKQEMAASLLRGFDQELRMAAERSREPRNSERSQQKQPVPSQPGSANIRSASSIGSRSLQEAKEKALNIYQSNIKAEPARRQILQEPPSPPSPRPERFQTTTRTSSSGNARPLPSQNVKRTTSAPSSGGMPIFFHNSLKLDDLEMDGSIGDLEALTNDIVAEDDHSIGGDASVASVDMLTDQEKDDLEEKMIRMAMERSLSDSSSFLDVTPFTKSEEAMPNTIDIGSDGDEAEGPAEMELEDELMKLAMMRSLNESTLSIYTADTTTAMTSEESGSSATAENSYSADYRARPGVGGPSRRSPRLPGSVSSNYSNGMGDATVGSKSRVNPRPRSASSINSNNDQRAPLRRVQRPRARRDSGGNGAGERRMSNGAEPGERRMSNGAGPGERRNSNSGRGPRSERRSSGSHGAPERARSSNSQNATNKEKARPASRRQLRGSRPVQDI